MNFKYDFGDWVGIASSNRNKIIACGICGETMRSDTLRRHSIAKHKDYASSFQHEYHHEDEIILKVFLRIKKQMRKKYYSTFASMVEKCFCGIRIAMYPCLVEICMELT